MRTVKLIFFFILLGVVCPVQGQSWLWAREDVPSVFGGGDPMGDHCAFTDPSGNIYITGFFQDTISFGSFTLHSITVDTYLVKYNSQGQVIWASQSVSGYNGFTMGNSLTCDQAGNIYLTGAFHGNVNFAQTALISPTDAVFLVKYGPNGNVLWARNSQSANFHSSSYGEEVTADNTGNIYVTGEFLDTVSFGSFSVKTIAFSMCMFLAKYDANGNPIWVRQNGPMNTTSSTSGLTLAVDPAGYSYVAGSFLQPLSFGSITLPGYSTGNSYLVKFDPSGNPLWARQITGVSLADFVKVNSLSADAGGNIFVTGYFQGGISFGSISHLGGPKDMFLAKYNSAGRVLWAKVDKIPPDNTTWQGYSVVSDNQARGGCYLLASGTNTNSVQTFIFGQDTLSLNSGFTQANVLLSIDSLGSIRCGSIFSEGGEDDGSTVTVDPGGQYIYVTGDIMSPLVIGNDSLHYGRDQTFVARWMDCSSTWLATSLQTVNACNGPCTGMAVVHPSGGFPPYTYSWSPSGGTTDTAKELCVGTYTCFIRDAHNKLLTDTLVIVEPISILTAVCGTGGTILPGHDTTLSISASGGCPVYTYLWNGIPGTSAMTVNPGTSTTYTITVTDSIGCSVTRTMLITVEPCASLFIPNVFSPNNDGENDRECIYGSECFQDLDFIIYDRWGEKVFETTNPNQCWDGTYKGRAMESAVYVYYLKGTLLNGQAFEKKGNISLVR